ncbi:MAG: hypothetical protein JOZ00_03790 [Mycobacterium sp.]|uniref:hypothetical protein n=1 Tax=Mycobacterium sp. TaxID=1785 RepID=UPI001EC35530|nr:hypothetical protein [Mycobacterium sp.]MBV8785790.1 hypothetical protein [Mycobacterium sp.]
MEPDVVAPLVAVGAGKTKRLSSLDLLDDDDYSQLDEWGNRAVLTKPAGNLNPIQSCSQHRHVRRNADSPSAEADRHELAG